MDDTDRLRELREELDRVERNARLLLVLCGFAVGLAAAQLIYSILRLIS